MRFSTLLAAPAFALLAQIGLTAAHPGPYTWDCLTDQDAFVVANNFAQTISNFSVPLAEAVFSDDFTDQSDSVNSLIDGGMQTPFPLGNLTFTSKAQLISSQGSQANVPFTLLNIWHTCDHVFFRWVSKQQPQQVQGIDIAQVTPQTNYSNWAEYGRFQISMIYGEFNSAAWIQNAPSNCTITCPPMPGLPGMSGNHTSS